MWLLGNSCPAVFMWLCVNYPVYLVPVFWVRFRLVYSLLLVFPVCQLCLVLIKDCYLSLRSRLRVPVSSLLCAPWQKTRPNRKRHPFTSFCFFVFERFVLFLCFVRWPRALMPADRGRYPPPAVAIPSPPAGSLVPPSPPSAAHPARGSREMTPPFTAHRARRLQEMTPPSAAHPGPPFAGDHAAGPPLTLARRPPLTLTPWIQSTRHGQECRVCLVVPTGTF